MSTPLSWPTISSTEFSGNSYILVYADGNKRLSNVELISYVQDNFTSPDYIENIYTPGDGFNIVIEQDAQRRWINLVPTGALATGTLVLPAPSVAADGQQVLITSTNQITTFTVNGNGATAIYGVPATFAAEDKVTLRYSKQQNSWHAVA
jgi:hypothetical protein